VAFDFPAFDHGCVCCETINGSYQEDGEREECCAVDHEEDHEMGEGPDGWAEVGGEVAVLPDYEGTGEEVIGEYRHTDDGVEDKAEEVGEGGVGDAICGPGAMMVHFGNASSTLSAMMRSWGLQSFAFLTPSHPLPQFHTTTFILSIIFTTSHIILHFPNPSFRPWINRARPIVAPPNRNHEAIEPDGLSSTQWPRLYVVE